MVSYEGKGKEHRVNFGKEEGDKVKGMGGVVMNSRENKGKENTGWECFSGQTKEN